MWRKHIVIIAVGLAAGCATGCMTPVPGKAIRDTGGFYGAMVSGPPRINFAENPQLSDDKLKAILPDLAADRRWVELSLDGTQVTDDAIPGVLSLPQLRILRVSGTQVTIGGIKAAAADQRIIRIGASPFQVTPSERDALKQARPDLDLIRYLPSGKTTTRQQLEAVLAHPNEDTWVREACEKRLREQYYSE